MIIVITGSRKGIGLHLSKYYAEKGHTIIGCSRGKSDYTHPNYTHFCIDVCDEGQVNQLAGEVRKTHGSIDALINNAGSASMNHFMLTPASTARKLMDINYIGGFNCSRSFINLLKKSKNPRIINFTTIAVPLNLEGELAYVCSKSAVESFTKVLAKELALFNITVNAVGPTPIQTDLIAKVPQDKLDKLIENQAIKRFGKCEDVANVVDFYLSEQSSFITGQIVYLGGIAR